MCNRRYLTTLETLHVTHTLHLWMDTVNAPASSIGDTIIKVADEASADLVVMSSHNKVPFTHSRPHRVHSTCAPFSLSTPPTRNHSFLYP
jgi:nucleotide-binding universal stress UspA family protein